MQLSRIHHSMTTTTARMTTLRVAAVVVLGLAIACRVESPERLPTISSSGSNLIVVLSDTHRMDYVSGFTQRNPKLTPHLSSLMRDGVSFSEAYTPVPISAPAYASLMTGLRPTAHGLLNNEQHLGPDFPLLQEHLRGAGYRTAAVVGNPYCSAAHGFDRGFDFFWDRIDGLGKEGEIITDQAIRWLDTRPDHQPFFLFLAYMDAHTPYISDEIPPSLRIELNGARLRDERAENAHIEQRYAFTLRPGRNVITLSFLDGGRPALPADEPSSLHFKGLRLSSGLDLTRVDGMTEVTGTGFERLANRANLVVTNPGAADSEDELVFRCYRDYRHGSIPGLYEAGVRSFDRSLGRLFEHLRAGGLYDDAIIVFISDHGEMLGEHDAWGHVGHLYQETIRVPLVIKAPELQGGRWDPTRVDLRDLHDLLLDMTIGPEADRSDSRRTGSGEPFVAATYPPEAGRLQATAIQNGLKVLVTADGEEYVFDLDADPGETTDLILSLDRDPRVKALLAVAHEELAAAAAAESLDLTMLSAEERDRLRALGYHGSGS